MKLIKILPYKAKKSLSIILIALLIIPFMFSNAPVATAAADIQVQQYHDYQIASGINFQANNYRDYQGIAGRYQDEYIINADLNDPSVQIIAGKAYDKVGKIATLSNQIAREQSQGQNVVGGINGDMFNISLGTVHYGAPLGLQVKDGQILTGFETALSEFRYPVFAIDSNRQAMIAYLSMDASLSVVKNQMETNHASANPDLKIAIDTINRNNTAVMDDRMILITPQLADNPIVGFSDSQASNAALTVLKNIKGSNDGSVRLGQEYEAVVATIGETSTGVKSAVVPADGMILASQGIKATWVKEHLQPGDKVKFSFNLLDQAGNKLDLLQAVSTFLPLVENEQALTKEDLLKLCENDWDHGRAVISASNKARTAIGLTRDNKVIALVYDGGGTGRNSYGISLPDMAKRMEQLGAVVAASLDGGGSTQMNTRLFGETQVQVINNPSDRIERPVSNSILFASTAPRLSDIGELRINQDITIFKNNSYAFQARAQDSNGHPVDLNNADIKWSIQPAQSGSSKVSGTIDNKGTFIAGSSAARQIVTASLASSPVIGTAQVNVVDSLYSLAFTDNGVLAVEPNVPRQLQITAATPSGDPVLIANDTAEWTVSPSSIAKIDQQGLLTAKKKGTGIVSVKAGGQESFISFISGQDAQLIDSFETHDSDSYYVNGYVGGTCEVSAQQAKNGLNGLKVNYDYTSWAKVYNGTVNIYLDEDKKGSSYSTYIRPQQLGMWVYGDGQAPWLRAGIKDGSGNDHILNLASRITWKGWQYVSSPIPNDIPLPISLEYFYMVETDKSKNLKGAVFFDDLSFIYSDRKGAPDTASPPPVIPLPAPVEAVQASPTSAKFIIDGKESVFYAYLIDNYNYIKLRDIAKAVNGSAKQFEVQWDNPKKIINLISQHAYTLTGGELAQGDGKDKTAVLNSFTVNKDGTEMMLTAYTIEGYNYVKLRDIAQAFDIGITYTNSTNTVGIHTDTSYVAP
ncbi:MAG: phosphodiester glycosidase family protein [Syntrophomonas sp.]|nr:phosphodiester glycosidase family protein [Syntrophomonas sp.]